MDLGRWTPLTFLVPGWYVAEGSFWTEFDLEDWSRTEYDWTRDPWNGVRDFAQPPRETVSDGAGDCEDYALVAVAWAAAHDRDGIGIAFCWERPFPWPRHVVAYDDERVYSSGHIIEQDVDDWVADSRYAFAIRRRVHP